jgi:hypothetical protein
MDGVSAFSNAIINKMGKLMDEDKEYNMREK